MTTNWLVCYDVVEDDIRYAVANCCKNVGMIRIQYSVFFGQLEQSTVRNLRKQLEEIIAGANANIHIIRVCASCESEHRVIASAVVGDQTFLADEGYEEVSEELDKFGGVLIL